MTAYWIAVASREHVLKGVEGSFAQACHGKKGPINQLIERDWIVYYSPTERFGKKAPCRKFTAIGRVQSGHAYPFAMSEDFIPWRRDVLFLPCREIQIEPLLEELSFIKNKQRWGFPFLRGLFKVPESDFRIIATQMQVNLS